MPATLASTPLAAWHAAHGGRMVDFAGWSMPVQYTSITAEHLATRAAASLFDVSHMGRLRFTGPGAAALLDSVLTRHVAPLAPGRVAYSLVCNERGGVLDDVLVSHLVDGGGESYYLLVVNAGNRDKIVGWLAERAPSGPTASWQDVSDQWSMIAIQGPRAREILQPLVDHDLAALGYYQAAETRVAGGGGIVSRTGYTGEDGFELFVGTAAVVRLWETLIDRGQAAGLVAAGLGARDTLRLEAGMPLYGHELAEEIDPYQAGLGFAVALDKGPFVGREALARLATDHSRPCRVGLEVAGQRPAREGYPILQGDEPIGRVTSGTFSPTLARPIAMGYVRPEFRSLGSELTIDVRGRREPARVVALPFYRRGTRKE